MAEIGNDVIAVTEIVSFQNKAVASEEKANSIMSSKKIYNGDAMRDLTLKCLSIFLAAAVGSFLFNWLMPQGIEYLPPEVLNPLWKPIELGEAFNRFNRNVLFVDARNPSQYKQDHVDKAVNLPPAELELFFPLLEHALESADAIVVYGRNYSSWPAATIAQWLRQQGLNQVFVLSTSFAQWVRAGYPTGGDATSENRL